MRWPLDGPTKCGVPRARGMGHAGEARKTCGVAMACVQAWPLDGPRSAGYCGPAARGMQAKPGKPAALRWHVSGLGLSTVQEVRGTAGPRHQVQAERLDRPRGGRCCAFRLSRRREVLNVSIVPEAAGTVRLDHPGGRRSRRLGRPRGERVY